MTYNDKIFVDVYAAYEFNPQNNPVTSNPREIYLKKRGELDNDSSVEAQLELALITQKVRKIALLNLEIDQFYRVDKVLSRLEDGDDTGYATPVVYLIDRKFLPFGMYREQKEDDLDPSNPSDEVKIWRLYRNMFDIMSLEPLPISFFA